MRINEILGQQNMTKYRLSKESGVPYTTVNELCNGKLSVGKCAAATVYKLSKILGVSVEDLMADEMKYDKDWGRKRMTSLTRNDFLTSRAWHRAVVGGQNMILRHTSALEHLELFNGYFGEKTIDVYAKRPGRHENINYHIVDTFDGIDTVRFRNVLCASANQTFNDMLADFDNIDEQALIEGLAGYYFSNGESFGGLSIKPENMDRFNSVKDWAIEYYNGG